MFCLLLDDTHIYGSKSCDRLTSPCKDQHIQFFPGTGQDISIQLFPLASITLSSTMSEGHSCIWICPFHQFHLPQLSNSAMWCLASAVGHDHSVLPLSYLQIQDQAWNFFTYSQNQLQAWEAELTIPPLSDHSFCILTLKKWFPEDFNTLTLIFISNWFSIPTDQNTLLSR